MITFVLQWVELISAYVTFGFEWRSFGFDPPQSSCRFRTAKLLKRYSMMYCSEEASDDDYMYVRYTNMSDVLMIAARPAFDT